MDRDWLAAYTRPRHEEVVTAFCLERGIETFLPRYQTWRQWSDRRKLIELPLFPSYVFLRTRMEQRERAVQAPGFLWFVRNRTGPVKVSETELDALRLALASGLEIDPLPGVEVGDEVEVTTGAMRGCRGFLEAKNGNAIILQVTAIGGAARVRLPDPSWVRPCPAHTNTPRQDAKGSPRAQRAIAGAL